MMSPRIRHAAAAALLALAGLAGAASAARADVAAADPIDTAMQRCLARADRSSTAGQVQCIGAANDAWRAAIDTAYQSLVAAASSDKLRAGWELSQRRWLAWRDAEAHLVHAVFATTRGTAYEMSAANLELQPVRDRALTLREAAARLAQAKQAGDAAPVARRVPPCSADAECTHADFDLNRYYRKLRDKLPAHSRPALVRAQRLWLAYRDSMAQLVGASDRVDLIGARIATIKRFSETVGNR
jgi:uncharacterized protein YecT (DUF1311 family)